MGKLLVHTRDVGKKLEQHVLEVIKTVDPTAKLTNNSGAVSGNGDISSYFFQIECKKKNKKNCIINIDIWNKLCYSIQIGSNKIPILFMENLNKDKFAITDLKDFERLIQKAYNGKTKEK